MKNRPRETARNATCPCGSGKKFKNCCIGKRAAPSASTKLWVAPLLAIVVLGAVGIIAAQRGTGGAAPQARAHTGRTPEPWEYDETNDRHWHPGHGHWHSGPPPEDAEALAAGATPEPWEYDEARDQHWDPRCNHWHSGPPPEDAEALAAGATPEPWEYDEANDRYWHPGHGHWHSGPPPEDAGQ